MLIFLALLGVYKRVASNQVGVHVLDLISFDGSQLLWMGFEKNWWRRISVLGKQQRALFTVPLWEKGYKNPEEEEKSWVNKEGLASIRMIVQKIWGKKEDR